MKGFVVKPKALNCPNCGAAIVLRALGAATSVVCGYCNSTLDATNQNLKLIATWESKLKIEPRIPLGSRGKLKEVLWEVIGFQQRGINVDGATYFWREYVLWNPYRGFRYLTEYDGHWNFVTPLQAIPATASSWGKPNAIYDGTAYRHFQNARAYTYFVLGEFPWIVQVGEAVDASDYVAPPRMLSSERTENEVTWSLGEYTEPRAIWQAFQAPGSPPPVIGVYANQPSPYKGRAAGNWKLFGAAALGLLVMMIFFAVTARREQVFEQRYAVSTGPVERSFVTSTFDLKGEKDTVEVKLDTDVENAWAYFSMALINEDTGEAYDFGREVSYYSGVDSDGSWTEGSRTDDVTLPAIPGGRYYLRVEPEGEPNARMNYTIRVIRGVPYYLRYLVGIFLLLIPPVWMSLRSFSFESRRWSESDYAGGSDDE